MHNFSICIIPALAKTKLSSSARKYFSISPIQPFLCANSSLPCRILFPFIKNRDTTSTEAFIPGIAGSVVSRLVRARSVGTVIHMEKEILTQRVVNISKHETRPPSCPRGRRTPLTYTPRHICMSSDTRRATSRRKEYGNRGRNSLPGSRDC